MLREDIEVMTARNKDGASSPARYDGIDAFRVVGIYTVVYYHFHLAWGQQIPITWFERLRGCAFPFVIMTSFFVLSRSILSKPERGFRRFFTGRFKRIEIPFLIWTFIYWVLLGVFLPLAKGKPVAQPQATWLISGIAHLWFLQFLFLGSLVLYPLLDFYSSRKRYRWQIALACVVAALAHVVWLRPILEHSIKGGGLSHLEVHLQILIYEVNDYFPYIPLALAIALYADKISAFYQRRANRVLALFAVALIMFVHLVNDSLPFTKGIYSLVVFLALLQPIPARIVNSLRPIATYSYPIYILHLLVSSVVVSFLYRSRIEPSASLVLLGSVLIFGLSLLASVVMRRLFPWDWFLPLIPIKRREVDSERGYKPAILNQQAVKQADL